MICKGISRGKREWVGRNGRAKYGGPRGPVVNNCAALCVAARRIPGQISILYLIRSIRLNMFSFRLLWHSGRGQLATPHPSSLIVLVHNCTYVLNFSNKTNYVGLPVQVRAESLGRFVSCTCWGIYYWKRMFWYRLRHSRLGTCYTLSLPYHFYLSYTLLSIKYQ